MTSRRRSLLILAALLLMLWANRNGFYYILDRETGAFRRGRPFVKQTWAKGLTTEGRPIVADGSAPSAKGSLVWPSVGGGTNWWSPSYSPVTDLFYVGAVEQAGVFFRGAEATTRPGEFVLGSASQRVTQAKTSIRALNAETGDLVWQYPFAPGSRVSLSGALSTAANVVFAGGRDDLFVALDAETGAELWRVERRTTVGDDLRRPKPLHVRGESLTSGNSGPPAPNCSAGTRAIGGREHIRMDGTLFATELRGDLSKSATSKLARKDREGARFGAEARRSVRRVW